MDYKDYKDKSYWVQKIKTQFGFLCPSMDVSLFQTSQGKPVLADSEVKVNPFNMEKAIAIKESFNLGKLDWAIVLVKTDRVIPPLEEDAVQKIKSWTEGGARDPSRLSNDLKSVVKASQLRLLHGPSLWACQQPVHIDGLHL